MVTVILTACWAFGLTVSQAKTKILCLKKKIEETCRSTSLCSRPGIQTGGRVCVFGWGYQREVTRRLQKAWAHIGRYNTEMFARPGVRLRLKMRLVKAEALETILYGYVTWSPKPADFYLRLRKHHHSMLLRYLGWRKRKREHHTLSYARALIKTDSEGMEATVHRRRILFAGFMIRVRERLPRRVMFGEMVGGNGYDIYTGLDRRRISSGS